MCNLAKTLLKDGQDKLGEGDEELAYVLLMKYFNLLQLIQKRQDYVHDKQFINAVWGFNSRVSEQMDQLEQIKRSLEMR